jgi:hypothetical protein
LLNLSKSSDSVPGGHERRDLYPALLKKATQYCFAHGARSVAIYCNVHNQSSFQGIRNAGFSNGNLLSLLRAGPLYIIVDGPLRGKATGGALVLEQIIGSQPPPARSR